jgi:hypothetical protein
MKQSSGQINNKLLSLSSYKEHILFSNEKLCEQFGTYVHFLQMVYTYTAGLARITSL